MRGKMSTVFNVSKENKEKLLELTNEMRALHSVNSNIPLPDMALRRIEISINESNRIYMSQINLIFEFLHSAIDCTRSYIRTEHYRECCEFSQLALKYLSVINDVYLENVH